MTARRRRHGAPRRVLALILARPLAKTTRHPNRPVVAVGRVLAPYTVAATTALVCALPMVGAA